MKSLSLYIILIPALYSAYAITGFVRKWWFRTKTKPIKPSWTFKTLFTNHIVDVFTNQSFETLNKIREQMTKAVCKTPPNPLLLVFLTTPEAKSTAITLAKRLIQITLTSCNKPTVPWSATDTLLLEGTEISKMTSTSRFQQFIQDKLAYSNHLIITEFESVHRSCAALLLFSYDEFFFHEQEAYIYLIVEIPPEISSTSDALNHWVSTQLVSHLDPDMVPVTHKMLNAKACLIKAEDSSVVP